MYDTRTVFGRHIVARDDTEALVADAPVTVVIHIHRFHPRDELFVLHAHQIGTFVLARHLERNQFVARLIIL